MSGSAAPTSLSTLQKVLLLASALVLAAVLFALQGLTGTRDLLEIPLSWQKPAIYACDFQARTCPTAPPAAQ